MTACELAQHQKAQTKSKKPRSEFMRLLMKSIVALIVGVPLFINSLAENTLVTPGWNQVIWLAIGVVVFFVMWYSGGHFFSGGWLSFKSHKANMNTLISLATGPAWLYSMIIAAWPSLVPPLARHVYFDAPLTVIGLLVLGAAFELLAGERAALATKNLSKLQPETAHRKTGETFRDIHNKEIAVDDILEVRAGEYIPVDGVIVEGDSEVDQSQLSGTAVKHKKTVGDEVLAGTRNESARLLIKATKSVKESALSQIIHTITQAQNSKPSISGFSDRVASIFAPFVLIFSLLTLLTWLNFGPAPQVAYMLVTFMSVLLIACPCALGLATSISTTVGVSKAAQCGILFREGEAFMVTKKVNMVVFDKIRPDCKDVISRMKSLGIKTALIEGDAQSVDADESWSGLSAQELMDKVAEYQKQGKVVAIVGHGTNDKDLMNTADVSFALGIHAYAAEAAQVAVLSESVFGVLDAIRISKSTMRNIVQNLTGAFFYNLFGLPIAAGVLYPLTGTLLDPVLAGTLMAGSSLAVIGNANRLNLFKPLKRIET